MFPEFLFLTIGMVNIEGLEGVALEGKGSSSFMVVWGVTPSPH